eukprot:jgi/Chrzof1/6089/Cz17g09090.t1
MPAPDIPFLDRPWRQQRHLNEEKFKDECSRWDINTAAFSPIVWARYQPLLRADFKLFDEYEYAKVVSSSFTFPITAFWGSQDQRITQDMVKVWSENTEGVVMLYATIMTHHSTVASWSKRGGGVGRSLTEHYPCAQTQTQHEQTHV